MDLVLVSMSLCLITLATGLNEFIIGHAEAQRRVDALQQGSCHSASQTGEPSMEEFFRCSHLERSLSLL